MAFAITHAPTAAACAAATTQLGWLAALIAWWDGLDVTAKAYGPGDVLRKTVELAPWVIDTSGPVIGFRPGARLGTTHASAGDQTRLAFEVDGIEIFSFNSGLTGSGAAVIFAKAAKALCKPKLDALFVTAPTHLPRTEFAAGRIEIISLNTQEAIDPDDDPLANPLHPTSPGPWNGDSTPRWNSVMAYCGSQLAPRLGTQGSLMEYGGAGHSAVNALFWKRFDVQSGMWVRQGARPPPTNGLFGLTPPNWAAWRAANPLNEAFDEVWGDWAYSHPNYPAGFSQDLGGTRAPEGCHTRNSYVTRPARKAGNGVGEVIIGWHATGGLSGTSITSANTFNLATDRWRRHANRRSNHGSSCGPMLYFAELDAVLGVSNESSGGTANYLDVLNCATDTWTNRAVITAGGKTYSIDATGFGWRDRDRNPWYVYCQHLAAASPSFTLFAVRADLVAAGTATSWTDIAFTADSYPTSGTTPESGMPGYSFTVGFGHCPIDGRFYATNRQHNSNKLWRLAPPSSGVITDTWALTEHTLAGLPLQGLAANGSTTRCFDYSRMNFCLAKGGFPWHDDRTTGDVLLITPPGIY